LLCTRVGRAEGSSPDVGVDNSSTRSLTLDVRRLARSDGASSTGNTRLAGIGGLGVRRVEPVHVDIVVVPQRHDEDHTLLEGRTHALQATLGSEVVGVAEDGLLSGAEFVVDRVAADASYVGCGLVIYLATLGVFATNLDKITVSSAVRGDELSDNCKRLGGVDGHAGAVEGSVAHPEGVVIATVLVTVT
jgi:hypothetical protein